MTSIKFMYIKTQILLYHKNYIFDMIKCRKSESDEVSRITGIEVLSKHISTLWGIQIFPSQ